jgi:crotonobetainyl-CoA:carnitine CoA-transferase CaiB-like acyl-CoA transferase
VFDVLKGVRVLDFGKFVAAPMSTWLLSNMGAEVIKVEPVGGSADREPFRMGETIDGAGFVQLHSNKQSICLNHEDTRGREVLARLVAASDVAVFGAPEGTLKRQKLDYEALQPINPRLVYLNVSAFTSVGPRADEVGFDGIGQALSGAAYMSGFGDVPMRSFCSFVDVSTGIYSAFALACALMERARTGKGHKIETSLMMSAYSAMSWLLVEQAVTGRNRTRSGNRAQSSGPSDVFRTRDGWIVVQVVGDAMFARVMRVIGRHEWATDARFRSDNDRAENGQILSDAVADWCHELTTREALGQLKAQRVPGAPVKSLQEALDDDQAAALELIQRVQHPGLGMPLPLFKAPVMVDGKLAALRTRPPLAGEHTEVVLRGLGYSTQDVRALRESGVV